MIRVYNTLSKQKEDFVPVRNDQVGVYLCGPTVYKPSHIGHMVGPVIFDTIKRYLQFSGYNVKFVINITDVDDKLIAEANRRGVSMKTVADEMTADYLDNLRSLGVDTVDCFPKATDYIPSMIAFTEKLIEQGFAYSSDGDVYFDVQKFPEYGKLSHRSLEQMLGEGGEMAGRKRSVCDFALWKSAKSGEPSWDSPWGAGRPGWHIECSVMSCYLLGETFDIHGGGLDLVFPHHENEVAQSEAAHGKTMAKFWLHNGLMQASSEVGKLGGRNTRTADVVASAEDQTQQETGKISKSRGASAFRELLAEFPPETIRFFLLSSHYRRPIDFSLERIAQVGTGLETFYRFFKRYDRITKDHFYTTDTPRTRQEGDFDPEDSVILQSVHQQRSKFLDFMDDDFNTGGAVGVLFDLLRVLNKYIDEAKLEFKREQKTISPNDVWPLIHGATVLRELGLTLGLFRIPPQETSDTESDSLVSPLVELLIELRKDAKKAKDFATADKIRTKLSEMGIQLEDRPGGVTDWTAVSN